MYSITDFLLEKQNNMTIFVQIIWMFFFWLDPQPGTDDQTSGQVVADGVANTDDMNLPGEDSCSFL